MTERELIEGCRAGDRNAQQALYAQTSERIYAVILKMTRDPDAALDVAQETYVRAFTHIAQFNGRASLATWMYRIAMNEALQFLRRKEAVRLHVEHLAAQASAPSNGDNLALASDIDEALSRLEPTDRAVVILRYHEGLDYEAIGAVMDCPAGTVASRLNRARHRLKELLGPAYESVEETSRVMHPMNRGPKRGEADRESEYTCGEGNAHE